MSANDVIDRTAKIVTDNVAISRELIGEIGMRNKSSYSDNGTMTMYFIVIVILAILGINIFARPSIKTTTKTTIKVITSNPQLFE